MAGRPHVLRTVDRPLQNMEATGITTDVVERMEQALKKDVQEELRRNHGKILLHDELEENPGKYKITALYEMVTENEIMTPGDVFELIMSEGYRVSMTFSFNLVDPELDPLLPGQLWPSSNCGFRPFRSADQLSASALQTDEQAPLPQALDEIIRRVEAALKDATHLMFNCQMVR